MSGPISTLPVSQRALDSPRALVRYEAARHALQLAHSVDEVKDIRDKAQAMAAYARQAKDTQLVEWATEIKVRAERRAGEMLAEMEKATGMLKRGRELPQSHHATTATLEQLGINKSQSSRWQKLAAVPEDKFEQAVAAAKEVAGEVTTAAMLRLGRAATRPLKSAEVVEARDHRHQPDHHHQAGAGAQGNVSGAHRELQRRKTGNGRNPALRGMAYLKPNREVERAVHALDGICCCLKELPVHELDPSQTRAWAKALKQSAILIRRFVRRLEHPVVDAATTKEATKGSAPTIRTHENSVIVASATDDGVFDLECLDDSLAEITCASRQQAKITGRHRSKLSVAVHLATCVPSVKSFDMSQINVSHIRPAGREGPVLVPVMSGHN